MAYVVPTVDDIKARFPEFEDDDDAAMSPFITAAMIWMDPTSWTEQDYFYGAMYLTAHYYSMYKNAALSGAAGGGGGVSADGPVSTFASEIKFEDFDVKLAQDSRQKNASVSVGASTTAKNLLDSTSYGILYQELRDANVFPIAIIGGY